MRVRTSRIFEETLDRTNVAFAKRILVDQATCWSSRLVMRVCVTSANGSVKRRSIETPRPRPVFMGTFQGSIHSRVASAMQPLSATRHRTSSLALDPRTLAPALRRDLDFSTVNLARCEWMWAPTGSVVSHALDAVEALRHDPYWSLFLFTRRKRQRRQSQRILETKLRDPFGEIPVDHHASCQERLDNRRAHRPRPTTKSTRP